MIVTTFGCQSTPLTEAPAPLISADNPDQLVIQAEQARNPAQRAELYIEAANGFLLQSNDAQAQTALDAVQFTQLPTRLADKWVRAQTKIYSATRNYQAAEQNLVRLSTWTLEDFLLLANICRGLHQHSCRADALIQASLASDFDPAALPLDIHDQIWAALNSAATAPKVFTHRYHHAWWQLQQAMREADSVAAQSIAWQKWTAKHPSHPATIRPPRMLAGLQSYQAPQIAVLLPLSGPLQSAGRAVRDGIVSAYIAAANPTPTGLTFYDTAATDLAQLWESVELSNADVVVGPLLRQDVERFSTLTESSTLPRLALNYLPNNELNDPRRYHLGLAIEDEATSLAQHLFDNGFNRVFALHSYDAWSSRANAAFTDHWPFAATHVAFEEVKGLTEAVGSAMDVAASTQRHRELQDILGEEVEFLPRARGDLDAVVAFTSNIESLALVPALRFHFADHLPVFATSQALRGNTALREGNRNLSGFTVTEMPLLYDPRYQEIATAFKARETSLAGLYALGVDAYRLAGWLPILDQSQQSFSIPGASGYLWLNNVGEFHRDLSPIQASELIDTHR